MKATIATRNNWSNSTKELMEYAYADYAKFHGIPYTPQVWPKTLKLPYIPSEQNIDQLIAGLQPRWAALCQLLKETAMRSGEALRLKPTDFDLERGIVTLNTPEKRSNPRQFKISNRLCAMLSRVLTQGKLWPNPDVARHLFDRQRNRIAEKLGNPNLKRISFHTFRHWKATMEYHRTKDILYVQRMLGHKSLKNTLIYTHLVDWKSDEFTCKVATTVDEASKLVEAGFDYVTQFEGKMIFRKRK